MSGSIWGHGRSAGQERTESCANEGPGGREARGSPRPCFNWSGEMRRSLREVRYHRTEKATAGSDRGRGFHHCRSGFRMNIYETHHVSCVSLWKLRTELCRRWLENKEVIRLCQSFDYLASGSGLPSKTHCTSIISWKIRRGRL